MRRERLLCYNGGTEGTPAEAVNIGTCNQHATSGHCRKVVESADAVHIECECAINGGYSAAEYGSARGRQDLLQLCMQQHVTAAHSVTVQRLWRPFKLLLPSVLVGQAAPGSRNKAGCSTLASAALCSCILEPPVEIAVHGRRVDRHACMPQQSCHSS